MKVTTHLSLAEYIGKGNENTDRLLNSTHPLLPFIVDRYEFFAKKLWASGPVAEVPMFLSTNAFLLWTGGVRMALSGHEGAVYSLFRTALESACYAFIISKDPSLAQVWSDRHKGEVERKASRKQFNGAVAKAVDQLDRRERGMGAFVEALYEASIDSGAHPNTRGVMNNVRAGTQTTDDTSFEIGSIYPGNSVQVFRALAAAVEFGHGVALVLACCLPTLTEDIVLSLRDSQQQFETKVKSPPKSA